MVVTRLVKVISHGLTHQEPWDNLEPALLLYYQSWIATNVILGQDNSLLG